MLNRIRLHLPARRQAVCFLRDVRTQHLAQINNTSMQQNSNSIPCPTCKTGELTIKNKREGFQIISLQSSCSNEDCESHIKKKTDVDVAFENLTPKEKKTFSMLESLIDDLYENGVDVSFFPAEAKLTLIKAARDITTELNYSNNCII